MIHYTLQGPGQELEIHEDKIRLVKKSWTSIFTKNTDREYFEIKDLSQFQIAVPKFLFFSGKIQWTTFEGETAYFKFSTHPAMVKKIETYLQKKVIKNHQNRALLKQDPKKKKKTYSAPVAA